MEQTDATTLQYADTEKYISWKEMKIDRAIVLAKQKSKQQPTKRKLKKTHRFKNLLKVLEITISWKWFWK